MVFSEAIRRLDSLKRTVKKRRISAERLENRQMLSANRDIINVSSFAPLETFELPPTTALTTADINQDGIEDIVVSEQALSVLLGDGNGGFQQSESQPLNFGPSPPSEYELLRRPDSIALAVGDMNNDGLPDVVVGGYEKMAVVLSESDTNENWTGFQPPTPLSGSARKLELADFNSDGFLDIASLTGDHVFHADWPTYPGGNLVEFEPRAEIRFGDGEGNFELVDELTAVELYAKELTGDNVADLLIREPDTLQAYTFDGAEFVASETFEIPTFDGVDHYWPGEKDTSPTATEFYFDVGPRYFVNDDPYPDVFISDSYYDFGIGDVSTGTYVAFGTANGDFETPLRISRGAFTDQWERYYPDLLPPPFVIDIDSNGLQDIFIVSDFGNGIAVVRQINSNAYARDAFQYRFPDIPINQSAFADLNQDGLLDAIASASVLANSNGVVGVLFGQPDGGFADATTFEIGHIGELRIFEDATTPFADVSGSHVRSYIRYSHETDTLEVRTIQGPNYYSVYANTNHDNQLDMFSTEWNSDQDSMRLVVYESQSDGSTSIEVIQGSLPSIVNTRHNRARC